MSKILEHNLFKINLNKLNECNVFLKLNTVNFEFKLHIVRLIEKKSELKY